MKRISVFALSLFLLAGLSACEPEMASSTVDEPASHPLLDKYTPFRLDVDVSGLSDKQREMVALLVEASEPIRSIYWQQAYGDGEALLESISDQDLKEFVVMNFGPWDRLEGNEPFIDTAGPKPAGANFYPANVTKEEFDAAAERNDELTSLYSMVRRDDAGDLMAVPYHAYFEEETQRISNLLKQAAELAEDPGFKKYLELRSEAILVDDYLESDRAWMDMKNNDIDVVIGPIETYEDQLYGYKAAHELFVLLKDQEWSARLSRYAALLPGLQEGLPVPDQYKSEVPGTDSDLGAYDVLVTAGDANAGSKTIAINLPNDERVQLEKGTRRLQLKNIMRAKFEKILVPIAGELVAEDQRSNVTFDAFFGNTMFHEVAHGLGIKNTITDRGTVREALRNHASAMEEGKADVLGLYMITELIEQDEWDGDLMNHYTTFMASIFRSIRFGSSSAHGRANLIRYNFFKEQGAFTFDEASGTYSVNPDAMASAVETLSNRILTMQGDGDYDAVEAFVNEYAKVGPDLQADLDRLSNAGIPVDIVYEQGPELLSLN
ncbi:MAG: Zn-dependent hydrolase [Rhodothermaceae bacterium]|nr:Zn-dependent hydrolase [Rhodothermaceae bacterium]